MMGAQQMKPTNQQYIVHVGQQQYSGRDNSSKFANSVAHNQKVNNEMHVDTVISEVNLSVGNDIKHITVADFAKIKTEPQSFDEVLIDRRNQCEPLKNIRSEEDKNILHSNVEHSVPEDDIPVPRNNCLELSPLPRPTSINVKTELLAPGIVIKCLKIDEQIDADLSNDYDNESTNKTSPTIQPETMIHFESIGAENKNQELVGNIIKFVKNPFAFPEKNPSIKEQMLNEKENEGDCLNKNIKSEPIVIVSLSDNESLSEYPVSSETPSETQSITKNKAEQSSITPNELHVKTENHYPTEDNQEIYEHASLKPNSLSYNLNSSLDVNLSDEDTSYESVVSKQPLKDAKSNISINSTLESSKYFSIIDISSVENDDLLVQRSQLNTSADKNATPCRRNIRRPYKLKRKLKIRKEAKRQKQSKTIFKTVGRKTKTKTTKTTKIREEDPTYMYSLSFSRNLPKLGVQTRKKKYNRTVKDKVISAIEDFPRPFKLEPANIQKQLSVAPELPRPVMFKTECGIKNKKTYLKPEFQPCVRLKRLKSKELLVPVNTKYRMNSSKFKSAISVDNHLNYHQMTSDNSYEFLIQRAFSLNPGLSSDHGYSYCNNQASLNRRFTTSYNVLTGTPKECLAEAESEYFSPQEHTSTFHFSTPDGSSMFSGPIDSGISTSTPSVSHNSTHSGKTLLLKIAAERAFINNHLIQFGYSPIQFDLYNNLHDLSVFLKYMCGNVNKN